MTVVHQHGPNPMKLNRSLVFVLYAMTFLMMFMPLGETLLSVWPPHLGDAAWRFGAAGLFSRALMTPLLGLVMLGVLAYLLGHRRAVLTTAVLASIAAVVLLVAEVLFALDAVQMRAQVREEAMTAFDLASLLAFFKIGTSMILTAVLGVGAWKIGRATPARAKGGKADPSASLLVGRHREAPAAASTPPDPDVSGG